MDRIHIALFATLDLVGQGPGGPEEDPVGFPFGGWQAPLVDEVVGEQVWWVVVGHLREQLHWSDVPGCWDNAVGSERWLRQPRQPAPAIFVLAAGRSQPRPPRSHVVRRG